MELNLPGGESAFEKVAAHFSWIGAAEAALIAASLALNLLLIGAACFRRGWFISNLAPAPWSFARGMTTMASYAFIFFGVLILVLMLKQEFGGVLEKAGIGELQLTVLGLVLGQALSLALAVVFNRQVKREAGVPAMALWKGSSALLAAAGVPLFLLVLGPTTLVVLVSVAAFRALGLPFEVQPLVGLLCQTDAVWFVVSITVFAVVVAPLVEEIFFRGILYPTLRARWGIMPAALVSSFFFALLHFHLPAFLPLLVLAFVLCMAYERTGSLPACIVAHGLFNSLSMILIWLFRSIP